MRRARNDGSERTVALDHMAAQQPPFSVAEIRTRVQCAAVIPQDEIADAPLVGVDELFLLHVVKELVEQRTAFSFVHSFDRKRHQPVDV